MEEGVRLIYVDLDHTLVCVDLFVERLVVGLLRNPFLIFQFATWYFAGGIVRVKMELARIFPLDAAILPFNPELVEYLQTERKRGVRLVLATAAPEPWANAVAKHLVFFDRVLATNASVGNLKGVRKLDRIRADAAAEPFAYAGDSSADRPIFEAAHLPIVVGGSAALAGRNSPHALLIGRRIRNARVWWKSVRPHQWSKNLLVFGPVVASHQVAQLWPAALLSFFGFSFLASAFYLLNDLYDIDLDRQHFQKRMRSLAAGSLHPSSALALLACLLGLVVLIASRLPVPFALTLLFYGVVTTAYSMKIKSMVVLDLVTLAFLYALRVFAGGTGCGVFISDWLFAFIFFLALSLAHLKRYVDLVERAHGGLTPPRPVYDLKDAPFLMHIGLASGLISVLVSALYITSSLTTPLYKTPRLLFLMCLLLFYWIERIWLFASRAKITGDPIVFIVRDRVSYAVIGLTLLIMWLAATY